MTPVQRQTRWPRSSSRKRWRTRSARGNRALKKARKRAAKKEKLAEAAVATFEALEIEAKATEAEAKALETKATEAKAKAKAAADAVAREAREAARATASSADDADDACVVVYGGKALRGGGAVRASGALRSVLPKGDNALPHVPCAGDVAPQDFRLVLRWKGARAESTAPTRSCGVGRGVGGGRGARARFRVGFLLVAARTKCSPFRCKTCTGRGG